MLMQITISQLLEVCTRGTSLIEKSLRDFFRTKGFIRIFEGFLLKTKGSLPKVNEIFGSEMPLGLYTMKYEISIGDY